ncbi:MAG: imidazole glycerol phosphate synthase subunit HisH, partial [Candidatus Desantisbacteria bacterium]
MIAIVDYGVGNLHSIGKVLERFSEVRITRSPLELTKAEKIVLPGVGAFFDAVSSLKTASIFNLLQELAKTKPILGICLGMQLLFSESTEGERTQGLDIIKGTVRRFEGEMKIPHIGWNTIEFAGNPLFSESTEGERTQGLDLIKGTVRRFEGEMKIPHIGWNTIEFAGNPLFSE